MTEEAHPLDRLAPELRGLLEQRPGATFLRADLQVHTPKDPHFPEKPEPTGPEARMDLARRYLRAAQERGIELVGITEHNDVSWIDELRRAAAALGLHLLPGFEVESKEGVHVLCLFDPARPVADLVDVLAQIGLSGEKRQTARLELRCNRYFAELLAFIQQECQGICIAAHIESNKGLLAALREGARVDAWKTPHLLAAQIAKPVEEISTGNGRILRDEDPTYHRERRPGYVLTSDARSLEKIGTTSCWIKMDAVGVEGLRQAFLDPGSRICFDDPHGRRRGARLLAARWEGDFLTEIGFTLNAELNCLIGGKGTGKSTVIETIRFAFALDYKNADVASAGEELLRGAFRSGSKVTVVIETAPPNPSRFVVERTAPHAPIVRDHLGQPQPGIDPASLGAPSVYGQKEIYGMAQDARARLDLLDGFAGDELREPLDTEREILRRLSTNGQVILDARRRITDAQEQLDELPGLEAWRTRFRGAGFEERLRERRQLDREERLLKSALTWLSARRELIVDAATRGNAPPSDLDDPELPNADLLTQAVAALRSTERAMTERLEGIAAEIDVAQERVSELRTAWADRREHRRVSFDAALRELQERMPEVDPERYLDVEKRIEQLTPLKQEVETLGVRVQSAMDERASLLIELQEVRGAKHRVRIAAAERLNEALAGSVRIELTYQGDRSAFQRRLSDLKSGVRAEVLQRLTEAEELSAATFAAHARAHTLEGFCGLAAGSSSALERALDEPAILDLEATELPDSVEMLLDVGVGEAPDYRPLARLSPGQKSTAMLLLTMQESEDPLIIDQPEDDLDNRFIYDDIVKRLRTIKQRRQFLIATHNANIPILGDAEQIVALETQENAGTVRSRLRAVGSIDAAPVRDAAELILEGGREAFELRRKKYAP